MLSKDTIGLWNYQKGYNRVTWQYDFNWHEYWIYWCFLDLRLYPWPGFGFGLTIGISSSDEVESKLKISYFWMRFLQILPWCSIIGLWIGWLSREKSRFRRRIIYFRQDEMKNNRFVTIKQMSIMSLTRAGAGMKPEVHRGLE